MERQDKVVLTLDSYEHGIMIRALNELRNDMLEEQRDPGPVEDVLLKTIDAPRRRGLHSLVSPQAGKSSTVPPLLLSPQSLMTLRGPPRKEDAGMKPDNKAGGPWLYALGLVPVIWFALLIAPAISGGISEIVNALPAAMNHPFKIVWCEDSVKTVLIFIAAYGLGIGIYLSSRRNYRRGEEHGSAKWGDPRAVNKKYRDRDLFKNRIFTQHVRMGLDGRKHRRNLNTLVVGGSGAGKSRFYAKVNICQCNTSFFILDCKGELLRDCGGLLERMGYEIKVVDLLNMEKSHCYNPFAYLKSDNDVQKMVTNLFKATTPKGSQSNDPFWDTAASMLLMALVFYLWYEAPEDEKNFPMVMEMLRAGEVREDDDSYQSPLDELFDRLEMRSPDHIAVKYYKDYRSGSAKTLKSIQITLASRLEKFNLSSVAALTATDELDLSSLGEKKVALFALIPDNDASFNFW